MTPLIPIAISLAQEFLPSLVGKIAGDKSGKVAKEVVDVAAEMTGVTVKKPDDAALIQEALRSSPELLIAFQSRLAELELEELQAYLGDRESARARDVAISKAGRLNIRADLMVIAAFISVTVIAVYLIKQPKIEVAVLTFLTTIGGMLMKNISTAFDFEFGSSRSSKGKSDDLSQVMAGLVNRSKGSE